jgi:hypothetical protein
LGCLFGIAIKRTFWTVEAGGERTLDFRLLFMFRQKASPDTNIMTRTKNPHSFTAVRVADGAPRSSSRDAIAFSTIKGSGLRASNNAPIGHENNMTLPIKMRKRTELR